jgi:hypothetical protein
MKRRTPAAPPATGTTLTIGTRTTGCGWGGRPIPLTGQRACRKCGAGHAAPPSVPRGSSTGSWPCQNIWPGKYQLAPRSAASTVWCGALVCAPRRTCSHDRRFSTGNAFRYAASRFARTRARDGFLLCAGVYMTNAVHAVNSAQHLGVEPGNRYAWYTWPTQELVFFRGALRFSGPMTKRVLSMNPAFSCHL